MTYKAHLGGVGGVPPRPTSSAEIQKSGGSWSVFVSESREITVPLSFRSRKNRFCPLSRSHLQFTPLETHKTMMAGRLRFSPLGLAVPHPLSFFL